MFYVHFHRIFDNNLKNYAKDNALQLDEVAEWLRRWTANPMCSARVGSNPILVVMFCFFLPFRLFLGSLQMRTASWACGLVS